MKILLVSSRFPLPPWRGNQLRTLQWLEALDDDEVVLVCPASPKQMLDDESRAELLRLPPGGLASMVGVVSALLRGRPAQEGLYDTPVGRRTVAAAVDDHRPDVAVIQMLRCGWAAEAIWKTDPGTPLIFDAIDCMGLHYQRAAESAPALMRPGFALEARRCRRRERELVDRTTMTVAVSRRDLGALGAAARGMIVTVAGSAAVLVGGPRAPEPTVLLSGNLGYRPTVRAAQWFADRVWPGVCERLPTARWLLAGARPAPAIRALNGRTGIEVHGDVDELAPFLAGAWVAVAPMASGSGVPLKIIEALAAGVPVVADPWSAAGLEDPTAVTTATGEAQWVERVAGLLEDRDRARLKAERGTTLWRSVYHPDRVHETIRAAVNAVARSGD